MDGFKKLNTPNTHTHAQKCTNKDKDKNMNTYKFTKPHRHAKTDTGPHITTKVKHTYIHIFVNTPLHPYTNVYTCALTQAKTCKEMPMHIQITNKYTPTYI